MSVFRIGSRVQEVVLVGMRGAQAGVLRAGASSRGWQVHVHVVHVCECLDGCIRGLHTRSTWFELY